jgi:hypothetical protein
MPLDIPGANQQKMFHDGNRMGKKHTRPSFSNEPGSWIIDHIMNLSRRRQNDIWLFFVNSNTRFLVAVPVHNNTAQEVVRGINALFAYLGHNYHNQEVRCFMGDGNRAYAADELNAFYQQFTYEFRDPAGNVIANPPIRTIWNSSPYTYHGKGLDRCVRTIRDAIGYRNLTIDQIQQIVQYYNHTYHIGIDCSPHEMMQNTDLEWQYIRACQERVRVVNDFYRRAGVSDYRRGNILVLHMDYSKTANRFAKQRRYWNEFGVFIAYEHGNVKVGIMNNNAMQAVTVPVYYTRKIARDTHDIQPEVLRDYVITPMQVLQLDLGWQRFLNRHDIIHNP